MYITKKDEKLYKTYKEAKEAIEEQLENFIANPDIAPSDFKVVIEEVID